MFITVITLYTFVELVTVKNNNIFIERLWRSLKYEHVYLFPASDGLECYRGIREYFEYYNNQRRHQSLDNEHPATFINKQQN